MVVVERRKRRRRVAVALLASATTALEPLKRRAVVPMRGGYDAQRQKDYEARIYGLDDSGWNSEAYVDGYEYEPSAPPGRRRTDDLGDFLSQIPVPDRKTGLVACAAGAALTMLGVSLFFEKNLIRLGNLLLVFGAFFVAGPKRAVAYLADTTKLRGTLVFGLGFFLILSGHPLLGTLVEVFGFFNLFGNLFPLLGAAIARLPIMNSLAGLANDAASFQPPRGGNNVPVDPFDVPGFAGGLGGHHRDPSF